MKKYIKKWVAAFLSAALLLMSFSACSTQNDRGLSSNDPVTITLWHYYNGAQQQTFDTLVSEFNDTVGKEKGIIVQSYSQGNVAELIEKAMDSLDGKVGSEQFPDMLAAYADTAYEINKRGMAADVSQYMTEEEISSYVEAYMEEGRFSEEGGIQLFPVAKATEVIMMNTTDWDAFSKATGASDEKFATWEGMVDVARSYYEYTDGLTPAVPDDGKAFFGKDALANYLIVGSMQLGCEIFSVQDGKVTYNLDEKVMRRLWDNYYVPYINGWYASSGRFRSDDAKTGIVISFAGSTSGALYFPKEVTREDGTVYPVGVKVYPLPTFEGVKEPYAVQQGAGIVVTKSEEKKEYASTVFLKWFTETENNLRFCLGSGYLPVKKEANQLEKVQQELKNSNIAEDSALYQTLSVGVDMANDYTLYTNTAFEDGTASRNLLESVFETKVKEDAARVEEMVAAGTKRSVAAASLNTDENFETWYESLLAAMNGLR